MINALSTCVLYNANYAPDQRAFSSTRGGTETGQMLSMDTDLVLPNELTATVTAACGVMSNGPEELAKWAASAEAIQITTPYITVGPLRDWLDAAAPILAARGISLCEWQRDCDLAIWPHTTAGFFKIKQKIPQFLEQLVTG
jgi:hypothetical protein